MTIICHLTPSKKRAKYLLIFHKCKIADIAVLFHHCINNTN